MPAPPVAFRATICPLPTPQHAGTPPPTPFGPSGKARRHYREREACGKYIRALTNSRQYQLRVYSQPLADICSGYGRAKMHGGIHCGLFPDLRAAKIARAELLRLLGTADTPLAIWKVAVQLQVRGVIPTGRRGPLLPHFVRRSGRAFVAAVTRLGVTIRTPPMPTPESAHALLWKKLTSNDRGGDVVAGGGHL